MNKPNGRNPIPQNPNANGYRVHQQNPYPYHQSPKPKTIVQTVVDNKVVAGTVVLTLSLSVMVLMLMSKTKLPEQPQSATPEVVKSSNQVVTPEVKAPSTTKTNSATQPASVTIEFGSDRVEATELQKKKEESDFNIAKTNAFREEGFAGSANLNKASYHGQESFMTTAIGITEMTYSDWQYQTGKAILDPKSGKSNVKPLTAITTDESMSITKTNYWNKMEDRYELPTSILVMRFQCIWNQGHEREIPMWNKLMLSFPNIKKEGWTKKNQLAVLSKYEEAQKALTVKHKLPIYHNGIFNRIKRSADVSKSKIDLS